MNRGIYSLASGMVATQQAMDVVSNNLANVNTGGFKADKVLFNDALQQELTNSDGTRIGTIGSGAAAKAQYTDLTQGNITETNNQLDLAIEGSGMFAVQGPNGETLYTRNGAFKRSSDGTLVTLQGYPVLDPNGKTIELRPGTVAVSANGSISTGQDGTTYAQIGIFDGTFSKSGSGAYRSANTAASTAKVKQGALESSNVNPITTMVDMISLGRNFELSQKSILAEDDMTQKLTSTLS
jgi:flagellar basal-body rod protein FlgG